MKTFLLGSRRHRPGFTLVELLVVIAIIAILAALILPALAIVSTKAKKTKASLECQEIATAIQGYDSAYGRFPVSSEAQAAAGANANNARNPNGDFTYGGTGHDAAGKLSWTLGTPVNGSVFNNAEVIAILMDVTNTTVTAVNQNHQKNPQQRIFLNAKMTGDTSSPGVGSDLVYRDPWGNPYIITMDLNYDGMCQDVFYCNANVSHQTGSSRRVEWSGQRRQYVKSE